MDPKTGVPNLCFSFCFVFCKQFLNWEQTGSHGRDTQVRMFKEIEFLKPPSFRHFLTEVKLYLNQDVTKFFQLFTKKNSSWMFSIYKRHTKHISLGPCCCLQSEIVEDSEGKMTLGLELTRFLGRKPLSFLLSSLRVGFCILCNPLLFFNSVSWACQSIGAPVPSYQTPRLVLYNQVVSWTIHLTSLGLCLHL